MKRRFNLFGIKALGGVCTLALVGFALVACSDDEPVKGIVDGAKINGYESVDLGLSVKWASCNVGAGAPESLGNYYAWGETMPKYEYLEGDDQLYEMPFSTLKVKEVIDANGNLTARYDAATSFMGAPWRTPTDDEMKELAERCRWTWTTVNGVQGYRVTGPSGASIFLPTGGDVQSDILTGDGVSGHYWTATCCMDDYNAYRAYLSSATPCVTLGRPRYIGMNVRAVAD